MEGVIYGTVGKTLTWENIKEILRKRCPMEHEKLISFIQLDVSCPLTRRKAKEILMILEDTGFCRYDEVKGVIELCEKKK